MEWIYKFFKRFSNVFHVHVYIILVLGAVSHSSTYDYKIKKLYFFGIPVFYLPSVEAEVDFKISASADAQISFRFVEPVDADESKSFILRKTNYCCVLALELVVGRVTKFEIGFANRGEKDFTVHFSHTSFRYPLDFSYHVQNVRFSIALITFIFLF